MRAELASESRVRKTLLNARVNLIFYFLTLILTFFSRKIFLDCLGANFIGLTGTLQNFLGYLNLAELGIGAAISFNLFKPIREKNQEEINNLVSVYGFYYRRIGLFVLTVGIILSLFIPLIFKHSDISFGVIYFAFYTMLWSSLLGYFVNYRAALLSADQKNYIVSGYFQACSIIKTIIQLCFAYYTTNYYIWIAIELTFGIINCLILNYKINKTYPWLKCSVELGKTQAQLHPNILKSTKQVFIHKLKDFTLTQSDQIFIFAFVSLKMVAYYGNYVLLMGKLSSLFSAVLGSVNASIGNLVAENNMSKTIKIFWELNSIRFFIAGFSCFCIYELISPFIILWLGKEYLLSQIVLIFLLIYSFNSYTRGTVDAFNHAYGHYADTWAAWLEGIINVSVTILGGIFWGLPGILLGKLTSAVPISILWKPYYLYRNGFHLKYSYYWKNLIKYYISFFIAAIITHGILKFVVINPTESYGWWVVYATICAAIFCAIYGGFLVMWCPGGKNLLQRLPIKRFVKL